jgi:fermentation-respiration switch protein FrsA (DUF1100 family)
MFMYFPNNYMWSAGLLRILHAGGVIGEVDQAGRKLRQASERGDNEAWYREWLALAEKVHRRARHELEDRHPRSARGGLIRASLYYQWSAAFLPPTDERKHAAHRQSVEVFRRACELLEPPIERVEVPYEGTSFPACFVPARSRTNGPMPCVLYLPGLDSTKEQGLRVGLELAERGIASLLADPPGVGEALLFRGLTARYDYEVPCTAALELLQQRPEVDPQRIAVCGVSLGGYYAPRAAAMEPRFAACVAWGAIWDYHEIWSRRRHISVDSPMPSPQFQIMTVTGQPTFDDALRELEKWRLHGVAEKITCPFLILHGEHDRQVFVSDAYKLCEAASSDQKELKIFTEQEGGSAHCQNDNRVLAINYIADWLEDVLVHGRKRSGVHVGER